MANQYRRGVSKEIVVRNWYRERGYNSERTAGSHGLWDVTSVNEAFVVITQVKWSKTGSGWKDKNYKAFVAFEVNRLTVKEVRLFIKGTKDPLVYVL